MKKLVIETDALKKNISVIIKKANGASVYAVVKGNGYGLGLVPFSKLLRKEGITRFAVTEAQDALTLRESGFEQEEILMLRPITDEKELGELITANVILTVASNDDALAASGVAEKLGTVAAIHLKIDTGMGRYGFFPDEVDKLVNIYKFMQRLAVCGIYTHFHSAFLSARATEAQYDAFRSVISKLHGLGYETGTVHCANSSALMLHPDMLCDAVRVGSAFLGRLSFKGSYGLTRVGYAEAGIEEIRWLPRDSTVGYGAAYKTKKPTQIAVLPIGWYNGFALENGRDVWSWKTSIRGCLSLVKSALTRKALYVTVKGQKCRVLGHVGMVQTVIDVTNVSCSAGDVARLEINPLLAKDLVVEYR